MASKVGLNQLSKLVYAILSHTAVSRLALHNPNRCVVESGKNTATVVTIFSLVHSFLMGTVLIFCRLKSLLLEWTIADCQLSLFVSM